MQLLIWWLELLELLKRKFLFSLIFYEKHKVLWMLIKQSKPLLSQAENLFKERNDINLIWKLLMEFKEKPRVYNFVFKGWRWSSSGYACSADCSNDGQYLAAGGPGYANDHLQMPVHRKRPRSVEIRQWVDLHYSAYSFTGKLPPNFLQHPF